MESNEGSIVFTVDLGVKDAEKRLADLKKKILKTQNDLEKQKISRDKIDSKTYDAEYENSIAKQNVKNIKKMMEIAPNPDRLESLGKELEIQEAAVKGSQEDLDRYGEQLEKANQKIEETESNLKYLKDEAEELQKDIVKAEAADMKKLQQLNDQLESSAKNSEKRAEESEKRAEESEKRAEESEKRAEESEKRAEESGEEAVRVVDRLKKKYDSVSRSAEKFTSRLKKMATRVLFFSLILSSLRKIKEYMTTVVKGNEEFSKSFSQLKGAAAAAVQPLIQNALPYLTSALQFLTKLLVQAGQLIASIFGTTYEQSVESAKALQDEAKATKDVANARESLAGFDTIQKIETSESNSSSDSSDSGMDFSGLVESELSQVEKLFTGLALMAIGAVLAFTGAHIFLGIAMIIAGAAEVYQAVSENPQALMDALNGTMEGAILALAGAALVVIGIIVACCGHLLLGFGLIAIGAVALGTAAAANEEAIAEFLQSPIVTATGLLVGAALVVIGMILMCTPHILLGIGLIAAGALVLGSEIALNWDAIAELLQNPIAAAVALLVGAALVVIGIILMFTPHILLGIGLIALGAVAIGMTIAANWDAIADTLRGPIGVVTAIVSGALLVLGVILLFTGAGIPLGLGLIAAGAVGLVATIAANWNWITEKIKGIADAIKGVFSNMWNFIKGIINGIIGGVESFVNFFIKGINFLIRGINMISFDVPDWVPFIGGMTFGFDIPEVREISLPRLANGGLIPPNREFLAMLGDNKTEDEIVSPVSAMKQAFKDALAEVGYSQGGDIHVTVELDGRVVAKNTVRHINQMNKAAGKPVIVG